MSVGGVGGKGSAGKSDAAKAKAAKGAFPPVEPPKVQPAAGAKGPGGGGGAAPAPAKAGGFQLSKQEPIKQVDAPQRPMQKEVVDFTQGMVQAADAACLPGPTSDSDLLPRESVSGLFIRDFALQGAVALGRPPLGEDEAARIVIEKHVAGQPGVYYDAAVTPAGDDHYLVKLHKLSPNPPFLPDPKPEAAYRINRRTWQVEET
jgi:hypothetical protein